VPREKTNMGTGIINLARNIGASVGIATVTTLLERRTQMHQVRLMDHVNDMNPALLKTLGGLAAVSLSGGGGPGGPGPTAQAHGMLFKMIERQATMLAFLDNYKLLGVIFFTIIPVFFLMKRPKMGGEAVSVH
jgi:DHA2 family multidrug resistance protein